MNLDSRLRQALRRVEPGEDFADRVLAQLDRPAPPERRTAPRWALAASVVLAIGLAALVGREAWRSHTQQLESARLQARAEVVSRQLAFALDLTSRELQSVHRHLEPKT